MKTSTLFSAACLVTLTGLAAAADWPQWQGPDRSNVSRETGLLKSWPKEGPRLLWTFANAGMGYTAPAIVGDRLYSMGARQDKEYLFAVDVKTGRQLWSCEIGPVSDDRGAIRQGNGPRGTPAVAGGLVYGLGSQGTLVCARADDGSRVWQQSLPKDLEGTRIGWWGWGESPLLDSGRVVCMPGGPKGTVAALDPKSGAVLWRSKGFTDEAGYASLVVSEAGGVRQYVVMTGASVAGVAAADGRLLWRHARHSGAPVPTPVCFDNFVYATSGYAGRCILLRLTATGGEFQCARVYKNRNMVNHHGGVLLVSGHLYGYSDTSDWACQDARSGELVPGWGDKAGLGKGSLTCADGHLYCFAEQDGTVALVEANPKVWTERGRFKLPRTSQLPRPKALRGRGNFWTHPVVANGRLYLRDQELIFCYDVKDGGSAPR
jgi:outer membrane protein assembly factor BamB